MSWIVHQSNCIKLSSSHHLPSETVDQQSRNLLRIQIDRGKKLKHNIPSSRELNENVCKLITEAMRIEMLVKPLGGSIITVVLSKPVLIQQFYYQQLLYELYFIKSLKSRINLTCMNMKLFFRMFPWTMHCSKSGVRPALVNF